MFLELKKSKLIIKYSEIEAVHENQDGEVMISTNNDDYKVQESYETIVELLKKGAEPYENQRIW